MIGGAHRGNWAAVVKVEPQESGAGVCPLQWQSGQMGFLDGQHSNANVGRNDSSPIGRPVGHIPCPNPQPLRLRGGVRRGVVRRGHGHGQGHPRAAHLRRQGDREGGPALPSQHHLWPGGAKRWGTEWAAEGYPPKSMAGGTAGRGRCPAVGGEQRSPAAVTSTPPAWRRSGAPARPPESPTAPSDHPQQQNLDDVARRLSTVGAGHVGLGAVWGGWCETAGVGGRQRAWPPKVGLGKHPKAQGCCWAGGPEGPTVQAAGEADGLHPIGTGEGEQRGTGWQGGVAEHWAQQVCGGEGLLGRAGPLMSSRSSRRKWWWTAHPQQRSTQSSGMVPPSPGELHLEGETARRRG